MKKICFVINSPIMIEPFLGPHIRKLSGEYQIHVATAFSGSTPTNNGGTSYIAHDIPIKRDISVLNDLRALFALVKLCIRENFTVILSVTPKAALLTALAGFPCGIKCRIHFFTGQVWANLKGVKRKMLMLFDRLVVILDTSILIDGHSQRKFLIEEKIVSSSKSYVLGSGSVSGVDTERFKADKSVMKIVRKELGIGEDEIVFIFVGRITKDKGIDELLQAFSLLRERYKNVKLLLVGYDEGNYSESVITPSEKGIVFVPPTSHPERYLQAADIFCCPSYREGFGLSVIEASSTELPVICSDAYGIMDSMVDNVTGLRCHVKDVSSLYNSMYTLYKDQKLRGDLGRNGRKRVKKEFSAERISNCLRDFLSILTA